jgi:hypothetical protein
VKRQRFITLVVAGALALTLVVVGAIYLFENPNLFSPNNIGPTPPTGWPGPSNTGVPTGTVLKVIHGDVNTTTDGQVIDSLDVEGGTINVKNNNVTIRRVRVVAPSTALSPIGIRVWDGHTGIVVTDCEINMMDRPSGVGIGYAGYTVQRCNIWGAMKSIQIGDHVTALDNWVHDPYTGGDSHTEDIAIFGSTTPTQSVIRHNSLSNPHSQTAVVFIKTDQGPVNGVIIDDNYLDGGNYTVYSVIGYWDHKTAPQNISVTNNVFTHNAVYGALDMDGNAVLIQSNAFTDGRIVK